MLGRACPAALDAAVDPLNSTTSDMLLADLEALIHRLEEEMHEAAANSRFEYAAWLRDGISELQREHRLMVQANV